MELDHWKRDNGYLYRQIVLDDLQRSLEKTRKTHEDGKEFTRQ
jgi:hypothetical protein